MKTIRLIALVLAVPSAVLLGHSHDIAFADGEYGTLYIDVLPDASNTTVGFGDIDVCTDKEDIGDGYGDDDGLLEVGECFSIDIVIAGAPDIRGSDLQLNYNPAVLKVTTYDWLNWKFGPGVGSSDTPPDTDGQFNTYWSGSVVSGDGVIQRIILEAVGNGVSDLFFTYSEGAGGQPAITDDLGGFHYPPEVLVDDSLGAMRVVVGGSCPSPVSPVGGIAEMPDVSGSSDRTDVAIAGLAAVAAVALAAGAWYASRRWVK